MSDWSDSVRPTIVWWGLRPALASRALSLTGLPDFERGVGLTVRPSVVVGAGVPEPDSELAADAHASLDVTQRLGPNVLASASVNTAFAETDGDTWRANLTRFDLYAPKRRPFFLEGSDIFQFGMGLGTDVVPFFSRSVGLVHDQQVPILTAGKLNGRVGDTILGALVVQTGTVGQVAPAATMGVVRVKQDLFGESSIGAIATFGDPTGQTGSWLTGVDFTCQTSSFRGNKTLQASGRASVMGRSGLTGDKTAAGFQIAYPPDLWSVSFTTRRVGDAYQPSLRARITGRAGASKRPRPSSAS